MWAVRADEPGDRETVPNLTEHLSFSFNSKLLGHSIGFLVYSIPKLVPELFYSFCEAHLGAVQGRLLLGVGMGHHFVMEGHQIFLYLYVMERDLAVHLLSTFFIAKLAKYEDVLGGGDEVVVVLAHDSCNLAYALVESNQVH